MKNKITTLTKEFVAQKTRHSVFTIDDIASAINSRTSGGILVIALAIKQLRKEGKVSYRGELKTHSTRIQKI